MKQPKFLWGLLLFVQLGLIGFPGLAHGFFYFERTTPDDQVVPGVTENEVDSTMTPVTSPVILESTPYLEVIGTSKPRTGSLDGLSTPIPLREALSRLIPRGWSLDLKAIADSPTITYESGVPWIRVLENIARTFDYHVTVYWTPRRIVFKPRQPSKTSPVGCVVGH